MCHVTIPNDPVEPPSDPRHAVEAAVARLRNGTNDVPTLVLRSERGRIRVQTDLSMQGVPAAFGQPLAVARDVTPIVIVDAYATVNFATPSASYLLAGDRDAPLVGHSLDRILAPVDGASGAAFATILTRIDDEPVCIEGARRDSPDESRLAITIERVRSVIRLDSFMVTFARRSAYEHRGESVDELALARCQAEIGASLIDEASFDGFLRRCARSMRITANVDRLRVTTAVSNIEVASGRTGRGRIVAESPDVDEPAPDAPLPPVVRFEAPLCSIEVLGTAPSEAACQLLERAGRRLSSAIAKRWAEDQLVAVAAQYTVLDAVSTALASRRLTTEMMLQTVARQLGRRRGTACIVELYDVARVRPERVVVCAGDEDTNNVLESIAKDMVVASVETPSTSMDLRRFLRNAGVNVDSIVSAPVRSAGTALGAIHVFGLDAHGAVEPNDEVFLRVIGDRLGLAIENARLEDAICEHVDMLEVRVAQRTAEVETALEGLRHAQSELMRSERLSSLGSLVAGVSHELNTPLGNALLVNSTLATKLAELQAAVAKGPLRKAAFETFLADCTLATQLLDRCLGSANELTASFKQVGIDQTSEQRREYDLATTVGEVVETLLPSLRHKRQVLELVVCESSRMNGYPGALGRIVTNLVRNAFLHGFEPEQEGQVRVEVGATPNGLVYVDVVDDGVGIPADAVGRIFDPFFTTKLGSGSSGLGLHIVFNLATNVLGGRITVDTEVGSGSRFRVELPREAPHCATSSGGPL